MGMDLTPADKGVWPWQFPKRMQEAALPELIENVRPKRDYADILVELFGPAEGPISVAPSPAPAVTYVWLVSGTLQIFAGSILDLSGSREVILVRRDEVVFIRQDRILDFSSIDLEEA